jgi:tetratricopeptide (TPR) repeat protein
MSANGRPDAFVSNRIGENLIARHKLADAEALFFSLDLSTNLHANLRLAAFHALRSELPQATERVRCALRIDPIDFGARLFDGALKISEGNYDQAIASFKTARDRRFNSAVLHTNLAIAYVQTGLKEKALQSLRRAVAIDPLNLNAVAFLADLAFAEGRSEDSIPSLRYFIRFEQKQSHMWGRLARALLHIGQPNEAIAALKRQGSINSDSSVWNNLGVAYSQKGDVTKAMESYKQAMTIGTSVSDYVYCVSAKNAATLLSKTGKPADVIKFVGRVVEAENVGVFCGDSDLSTIFILQFIAFSKTKEFARATYLGEEMLRREGCVLQLRAWVATWLLAIYSLNGNLTRAMELAGEFCQPEILSSLGNTPTRTQLVNNIAFVHLESGSFDEADRFLQMISGRIHKDPYPTATLGLLHLRRNHLDRAAELYAEALRLSPARDDKARIRQKWNLELGRTLLDSEPKQAARHLLRARDEEDGERGLASAAAEILRLLLP